MAAPAVFAIALAAQGGDLAADLRDAVLRPTPEMRREAAEELARRKEVTLERWLDAARGFGTFAPAAAGVRTERVPLWVGEAAPETTELHVYVPASYDASTPSPLLLQTHGTGGSGAGGHRMWQAVADELGMLVLSPSEPGENVGYTFTERERLSTLSALRWARLEYNVDENRIFASGISRGGHLTWDLALRYPDLFAGIAPMIGGPRIMLDRGENNIRYLENVLHLPIRDLQGSKDDEMLVHSLRYSFERLRELGAREAQLLEFPELGHWFDFTAVDWSPFWSGCARDPVPDEIVRRYARAGEGRAFWLEVLKPDPDVKEVFKLSVTKSQWERLDRFERREYIQEKADKKTARLEAVRTESGRIKLKGEGVRSFRVLYTEEMLPAGKTKDALLSWNGKTVRRKVKRSKKVLLTEFVERFDRTFLPVFEVTVP